MHNQHSIFFSPRISFESQKVHVILINMKMVLPLKFIQNLTERHISTNQMLPRVM